MTVNGEGNATTGSLQGLQNPKSGAKISGKRGHGARCSGSPMEENQQRTSFTIMTNLDGFYG
jgi:hypothetical protein